MYLRPTTSYGSIIPGSEYIRDLIRQGKISPEGAKRLRWMDHYARCGNALTPGLLFFPRDAFNDFPLEKRHGKAGLGSFRHIFSRGCLAAVGPVTTRQGPTSAKERWQPDDGHRRLSADLTDS